MLEKITFHAEGQVIATSDARPTAAALAAILPRFTGAIEQVPPAYSALKIDGKRAYDLARAGEEVVMKTRAVTIHSLKFSPERGGGPAKPVEGRQNGATPAEIPLHEATLLASVSKGTYIRSLARDIAVALGTVGHVTMLRRLKAGPFDLTHAISLDKLAEMGKARSLEDISLPLGAGLDDIPAIALDPVEAGALRQGRVLTGHAKDDGLHVAWSGETPVALVEVQDGDVRVVRGFNL